MQYVAKHTDMLIPRIRAIHTTKVQEIYIEMGYVRGQKLEAAWSGGHLTRDQTNTIMADIKKHAADLRGLEPLIRNLVSSTLHNPAYDVRVGTRFFGPLDI